MSDSNFGQDIRIESETSSEERVWPGFLVGMALHLVCIPLLAFGGYHLEASGYEDPGEQYIFLLPIVFVYLGGIAQVVYMVPAFWIARKRGVRPGFRKGLTLACALLFFLNAAFCGCLVTWG